MWTKNLSACALQDVIILVSYGVCRFCRRSLLGGVVQIEAIQELCKLLVVVSSEIQNNFLGMMLVIFALNSSSVMNNSPFSVLAAAEIYITLRLVLSWLEQKALVLDRFTLLLKIPLALAV